MARRTLAELHERIATVNTLLGRSYTFDVYSHRVIDASDQDRLCSGTVSFMVGYLDTFISGIQAFVNERVRGTAPFGVARGESFVPGPYGNVLVFESADANAAGTSYVRVLDQKGGERGYWNSDEWVEEPEEVIGAMCGAMLSPDPVTDPAKFYQFGPGATFPDGVTFTPHE